MIDDGTTQETRPDGCVRALAGIGWMAVIALAIALLPPQLSRLRFQEPPPAPTLPTVVGADNGFVALMPVLEKFEGKRPDELWSITEPGQPSDAAKAWLEQNRSLLAEALPALNKPSFAYPGGAFFTEAERDAMFRFYDLCALAAVASVSDAEAGRQAETVTRMTDLLIACDRLLAHGGPGIVYGSAIDGASQLTFKLTSLALRHPVSEAWPEWRRAVDVVRREPSPVGAFAVSLQFDDAICAALLLERPESKRYMDGSRPIGLPAWLFPCFIYDPWQTIANHHAFDTAMAEQAMLPRPQRQALPEPSQPPASALAYNAQARSRVAPWDQAILLSLDRADLLVLDRTIVVAVALLRREFDRQGTLPDSLEVLVAAGEMDQLPSDPFGDQPLHYDPQRAVIWSVGVNGIDDGGHEQVGMSLLKSNDIVVPLRFAQPPQDSQAPTR